MIEIKGVTKVSKDYQKTWNASSNQTQNLVYKHTVPGEEISLAVAFDVVVRQLNELQHLVFDLEERLRAVESKKKKG